MPTKMKALKDFRGRPGEGNMPGNSRMVEAGVEFTVDAEKRARELEIAGLAVPMSGGAKAEALLQNKMEPPLENKAAGDGPLNLAGGRTGAETGAASLSRPDRVQPTRNLPKRGARRGS